MGNIFSVSLSCDAIAHRCWDSIFGKEPYVRKLGENLAALTNSLQDLRSLKNDVKRRVEVAELQPLMKRLEQVHNWISRADAVETEVIEVLSHGTQQVEKLCCGGYCSKSYCSSYKYGKKVAKMVVDVDALKSKGVFEEVAAVENLPTALVNERAVEALTTSLKELKALKNDVKRRVEVAELQPFVKRLDQVNNWILRAETVETQVNELVSHSTQEVERLGQKVAEKLEEVDDIKRKGVFEEVAGQSLPTASVNERPVEPTVGMEPMLDKVWRHLEDKQVGRIGLYGMGGVGKTTLLTQIHNKLVQANFDLVIWIVVSKDHKLDAVQHKIGKKIGLPTDTWKDKGKDEKAEDIYRVLNGKKFVLFLDDIWEPVEIIKVGIPIPDERNKCKIIFTTRSEDVCGHMDAHKKVKVECLTWGEAWKLFREKVGSETLHDIHQDIYKLAETVAKECGGLPLALITIGRAMASKKTPQEWNHAIRVLQKSASKFSGMGDKVLPLLKFSYDNLPSGKVRSCFLYCALFPEDYAIKKDDLLYFWMCEEMLEEEGSVDEAKDESYSILGTLISACLLEEEGSECVKMHDVIRDMALWLSCDCGKENESILVHSGLRVAPEVQKWMNAKRVSLIENQFERLVQTPKSPNLLTLLLIGNYRQSLAMIGDGFFDNMLGLRVLDLSHNRHITQLPSGVSNLVSLQHLNLSWTGIRELPIELKALVNLLYLNLEFTRQLDFVPSNTISSFPKLKVLRMFECGSYDSNLFDAESGIIEELQDLKHINELTVSVAIPSCLPKWLSYPIFVDCTRSLCLSWDRKKRYYSSSLDISRLMGMKYLDNLEIMNYHHLEEFKIYWAGRVSNDPRNSIMTNQSSFVGLHHVFVTRCNNLKHLTWLIFAPNLSRLDVNDCEEMEKIINLERLGGVENVVKELNPFAKLTHLHLRWLPLLKSIYDSALPFPYLNQVKVFGCPKLKKLPLNSISSAQRCNLIIEGNESWWYGLEWEDEVSRNDFLPCFRKPSVAGKTYM